MKYQLLLQIPSEEDTILNFNTEQERQFWMNYAYSMRNEQLLWVDIPSTAPPFLLNLNLVSKIIPINTEETISRRRWK